MLIEQQIHDNIVCLKLGMLENNTYIIAQGNSCVVIDPPYNKFLVNYLVEKALTPAAVLLTHGHFDHCGGVKQLFDRFGSFPVYCHENDAAICGLASQNRWHVRCDDCQPDMLLSDGEITVSGLDFTVIATPGHSDGSVCLMHGDVMFSGDTLFAGTIGRTDLEGSNPSDMARSIAKLKSISEDYIVCPGHGEISTLSHEKATNPYFQQ